MASRDRQSGDTLIEVLVAGAIFAMIAVGGLAVMNRGTALAQRSLEITLVRQQLDSEAEAIRFIHDDYVAQYQKGKPTAAYTGSAAQWLEVTGRSEPEATEYERSTCPGDHDFANFDGHNTFLLDTAKAAVIPSNIRYTAATTYPQLRYDSSGNLVAAEGMWMEAEQSPAAANAPVPYYDIHIRACWTGADSSIATLGTIVRLYEPKN